MIVLNYVAGLIFSPSLFRFLMATTNKFNLVLSNGTQSNGEKKFWTDSFNAIMQLNRRFHSFEVTFDEQNYQTCLQMFRQITLQSAPIRKLVLREIEFEGPEDFVEVIRTMSCLEELQMTKVTFKTTQENPEVAAKMLKLAEVEPVKLRKLRTLVLERSDWKVLSYLIATQIKRLKVSSYSSDQKTFLVDFINLQQQMESMDLCFSTHLHLFEKPNFEKTVFKLKEFKMIEETFSMVWDPLLGFLKTYFLTLEELQINIPANKRDFLVDVLEKCHRLKKFVLYSDVPSDNEFYENLKAVVNIKDLTIKGSAKNFESLKNFLGIFPNLDRLKLSISENGDSVSSLLPFINQVNPELKSLLIRGLEGRFDIVFKSLKFLRIQSYSSCDDLVAFLKINPTIENLSIGFTNYREDFNETFDVLMDETNVKHLKIGGELDEMKSIFEMIKDDYRNLKSLELSIYIGRDDDIKVRKFEFPDNPSEWNSERSNDFDGIVPLPVHEWDHFEPDDYDAIGENLGDLGLVMFVDDLRDLDDLEDLDD